MIQFSITLFTLTVFLGNTVEVYIAKVLTSRTYLSDPISAGVGDRVGNYLPKLYCDSLMGADYLLTVCILCFLV